MMLTFRHYGSLLLILSAMVLSSRYAINHYYYRKKRGKSKEINEVIMFSADLPPLHKSKFSRCVITHSMNRLLYYLDTPRISIDICMYVLTNVDVANILIKLHYRGVKIRLIIDADMAYASGSHSKRLEKLGVPVRWMKSTHLMHHKFCLIDTAESIDPVYQVTQLLMMGSLNWTSQAISGNWEDVTVTSQETLIEQYRLEFERLWVLFRPVTDILRAKQ